MIDLFRKVYTVQSSSALSLLIYRVFARGFFEILKAMPRLTFKYLIDFLCRHFKSDVIKNQ